jgi:hypothetical protein
VERFRGAEFNPPLESVNQPGKSDK